MRFCFVVLSLSCVQIFMVMLKLDGVKYNNIVVVRL